MTEESKALARRATQIFNGMIVSPRVRPPGYQYQEIQSNRCLTAPAINMTPSGLVKSATGMLPVSTKTPFLNQSRGFLDTKW